MGSVIPSDLPGGPVVSHDVAGAEVAIARLADLRSVGTQSAHERQDFLPLLGCQGFALAITVEMPAAGKIVQVTGAGAVNEQRVERVIGEIVETEHMPHPVDPRSPRKHV